MSASKSRRLFLTGAGVSLALPFLPSALWTRRAGAAGTTSTPNRRFVAWFVPNGFNMPAWTPETQGTTTPITAATLPPTNASASVQIAAAFAGGAGANGKTLQPSSILPKVAIITGLDHQAIAQPQPPSAADAVPGGHGSGTGIFLNMISVNGYESSTLRTSLDQVLLPILNAGTPPPIASMQLGLQGDNGLCDNVACDFSRSMSWIKGAAQPVTYDPLTVYTQMFMSGAVTTAKPSASSTAAAAALLAERKSILDAVLAESNTLATRLSTSDNIKLQQYQQAIRDLETKLANSLAHPVVCTAPSPAPTSPGVLNFNRGITPSSIIETDMPALNTLMQLAITCGITRSITFMLGNGTSNNDYTFLIAGSTGVPHHGTSHHGGVPSKLDQLAQIDLWEMQQAVTFLEALDAAEDTDGQSTVLDNTTFYLSSDIGDGQNHNHWDMPVFVAGGASGKLNIKGQHINYLTGANALTWPRGLVANRNPNQNTGQVHISILNAHGMMTNTFGLVTSGPLPELMTS
jgi:hypothetical protein